MERHHALPKKGNLLDGPIAYPNKQGGNWCSQSCAVEKVAYQQHRSGQHNLQECQTAVRHESLKTMMEEEPHRTDTKPRFGYKIQLLYSFGSITHVLLWESPSGEMCIGKHQNAETLRSEYACWL